MNRVAGAAASSAQKNMEGAAVARAPSIRFVSPRFSEGPGSEVVVSLWRDRFRNPCLVAVGYYFFRFFLVAFFFVAAFFLRLAISVTSFHVMLESLESPQSLSTKNFPCDHNCFFGAHGRNS